MGVSSVNRRQPQLRSSPLTDDTAGGDRIFKLSPDVTLGDMINLIRRVQPIRRGWDGRG